MFNAVRSNLRRFSPERIQAARLSRLLRANAGTTDPWRLLVPVGGREIEYRFFFLCGFGKSGTNWVGSILNLHPQIRCEGEFFFNTLFWGLKEFSRPQHHIGHRDPYRTVALDSLYALVRNVMLCTSREKSGATCLGDRSPRELEEILPGAPTIWLLRDGRDVVVSYTYHYLRLSKRSADNIGYWPDEVRAAFAPFAREFDAEASPQRKTEAARGLLRERSWVRYVADLWAVRVDKDLNAMQEWTSPLLKIRYEDLHQDPDGESDRMYEFLGVNPGLAHARTREDRTSPGFAQEDPTSFYRKGVVGDWRNYDTPEFREAFEASAGRALARAGYADWNAAA